MQNETAPFAAAHPPSFPAGPSEAECRDALDWLQRYIIDRFGSATTEPLAGPWTRGQLVDAARPLPEEPHSLAQTVAFFEKQIAPGLLRWNHPRFAAYFSTSAPLPAIIAEALVAAHNSNVMLTSGSPAGAELETLVGRWYQQLLNVPTGLSPQFFTGASQSHQHALAVALHLKTNGEARRKGITGRRPFAIYTSELGHFLARKNAVAAGIGEDWVRSVPADAHGAMDLAALERIVDADLAAGAQPLMVVATVGTTSITSVDNVRAIAEICRRRSVYCYVDAAYGGAFACLPECPWVTAAWDLADAVCVNPHKGLFVPQGCSLLFLRHRDELRRVCSHRAEYLPDSEEADPMDFTFVCGLRVNTLASFFNMMTLGAAGIRRRMRNLLELANLAADRIAQDPMFELLAAPRFSTVCFTLRDAPGLSRQDTDDRMARACASLQSAGRCCISKTQYAGRAWFRLALGNIGTAREDVIFILDELRGAIAGEPHRLPR